MPQMPTFGQPGPVWRVESSSRSSVYHVRVDNLHLALFQKKERNLPELTPLYPFGVKCLAKQCKYHFSILGTVWQRN